MSFSTKSFQWYLSLSTDGLDGEGMTGDMSSQAGIEIQFLAYPAENAIPGVRLGHALGVQ
jgi:hypothetical protein